MNDMIMAGFQLGACFFLGLNMRALARDRVLRGMSLWAIAFFTAWTYYGVWNWHVLNQPLCFWTNVLMAVLYTAWFWQAVNATVNEEFT